MEYDDLMQAGFAVLSQGVGRPLTLNGITRTCVSADFEIVQALRATGFQDEFSDILELLRTHSIDMGIVDRSELTFNGRAVSVVKIFDDPTDPMIRLAIKAAHRRRTFDTWADGDGTSIADGDGSPLRV